MKYTKPLNETNEDAGYVNADVSIGRRGSTVPAEAIEAPQREIVAAIMHRFREWLPCRDFPFR